MEINFSIVNFLTYDDLEKIYSLQQKNNEILISKDNLKNYAENTNNIIIIAKSSNNIIGFLLAKNLIDTIDLEYIFVDKNCRNKNIASKCIDNLCIYSKKQYISNIMLEVRTKNKIAVSLYEKNDFKKINIRKNYYKNPSDDAYIYLKQV